MIQYYKHLKKLKLMDTPLGNVALDDHNGVVTDFSVEEYKGGFYRVYIYCGYINVLKMSSFGSAAIHDTKFSKYTNYRDFSFSTYMDWDKKDEPVDFKLYFFETKTKPFVGDMSFWQSSYKRGFELVFFNIGDDKVISDYEAHKPDNQRQHGKLRTGKRWKLDTLVINNEGE